MSRWFGPGTHAGSSTPAKTLTEVGWTAVYAGVLVAAASAVVAEGVPTAGCYPGCVGAVDPVLAVAGSATAVAGALLALAGKRLATTE